MPCSRSLPRRLPSGTRGAPAAAGAWVSIQRTRSAPVFQKPWTLPTPTNTTSPGAERVRLAVELGLDLAREEHVRLLERVVVRLGRAAELVVDREHRQRSAPNGLSTSIFTEIPL